MLSVNRQHAVGRDRCNKQQLLSPAGWQDRCSCQETGGWPGAEILPFRHVRTPPKAGTSQARTTGTPQQCGNDAYCPCGAMHCFGNVCSTHNRCVKWTSMVSDGFRLPVCALQQTWLTSCCHWCRSLLCAADVARVYCPWRRRQAPPRELVAVFLAVELLGAVSAALCSRSSSSRIPLYVAGCLTCVKGSVEGSVSRLKGPTLASHLHPVPCRCLAAAGCLLQPNTSNTISSATCHLSSANLHA